MDQIIVPDLPLIGVYQPRHATKNIDISEFPKDFCKAPIIAASKQTAGRHVIVKTSRREYQIGGEHPYLPNTFVPALDIRHGKALLVLISFWDRFSNQRAVKFSMPEFSRRYADANGGAFLRALRDLLRDFTKIYFRVKNMDTGEMLITYRILEEIFYYDAPIRRRDNRRVTDRQTEITFPSALFSAEFFETLCNTDEMQDQRLDQLRKIKHPLAQAAYFYIPAAASFHKPHDRPFEIRLTTLCAQVDYPLEPSRKRRLRLLEGATGHVRSVIQDLHNRETLGGKLIVSYRPCKEDPNDFVLQFWVAPRDLTPIERHGLGKMEQAFLQAGNTEDALRKRRSERRRLDAYQRALLEQIGVNLESSLTAFEVAASLMPNSRFNTLISECKATIIEQRHVKGDTVRNPTAFALDACVRAVGASKPQTIPITVQPQPNPPPPNKPAVVVTPKPQSQKPLEWNTCVQRFEQLDSTTKKQYLDQANLQIQQEATDAIKTESGNFAEIARYGLAVKICSETVQPKPTP